MRIASTTTIRWWTGLEWYNATFRGGQLSKWALSDTWRTNQRLEIYYSEHAHYTFHWIGKCHVSSSLVFDFFPCYWVFYVLHNGTRFLRQILMIFWTRLRWIWTTIRWKGLHFIICYWCSLLDFILALSDRLKVFGAARKESINIAWKTNALRPRLMIKVIEALEWWASNRCITYRSMC